MGKKTKQSQRTKNNVRPSSSSRSAELLNNTLPVGGVLVELSTGKVMPALFPTLAATATNFEHVLNPEFQMCVKKLNKKDPITKTKALQELCELVNSTGVEEVVAALPTWAHFYKTLTVDPDRKVREMTQVCQGAVVRACGRRLAPHLRQLVAPWLQAQHDEHAPAAAAARASLQNTFPDSKLPEVISFCKAEVMASLSDNLVGNVDAVISKKTDSAEEKELQLCRLVTSSLHGLEYFTQHLPVAHDEWLWAELTALLQANIFWKYGTHSSQQVRAAWYSAVGGLVERYKSTYAEQYGAKTMRMLLAAAREQNTLVAAQLWGCLLLFMYSVEGWQSYLDKKELFIKRILDVLENGGWGDAKHLSNILLPLLARLPQDMATKEFYEDFFKATFVGLQKKNVLNSKSERQSWITSLAECLRYVSVQQDDFAVGVVSGAHRAWLESVLCTQLDGQIGNNLVRCSATDMISTLKYWLKQSTDGNSEKYDQLVRNFWQNVGSTILAQIEKCSIDQDEITKLIDGHILFLQTMKVAFFQEIKNKQSIKFDGDQQPVAARAAPSAPQCDAAAAERYKHNLDELVHRVCSRYFELAARTELCNTVATPLITLLVDFDSEKLFEALARQFDVDTVYKFYDKVLRSWLTGDTMRCKALVDIVFLMMKHLTEEEQDMMFNTFKQFPPSVEEWCISVCTAHPHRARRAARRWARGADAARCVARLCARAVRDADSRAKNLLLMCLTSQEDGECVISKAAVSSIIETCTAAIADVDCPTLEHSGGLAAQLATTLHDREVDAHYVQLVRALFRLSALVPVGDPRLSADARREVCSSWQDGVAALAGARRALFLQDAATFVRAELLHDGDQLDVPRAEHMLSLCPHLFNDLDGAPELVAAVSAFTEQLLDAADDSITVKTFALRHECVTSQLNCLDEFDNETIHAVISGASDSDVAELTKPDLVSYARRALFRAVHLRSVLVHAVPRGDGPQESWCDALLADGRLSQHLLEAVYDCVVLHSLHEAYAFWPHYDIIKESKEKLDSLLSDIIACSSHHTRSKLAGALTELAAVKGYFWSYARRWFELRSGGDADGQDTDEPNVVKLEDIISGYGFFHSLQATTKWSSNEKRAYEIKYLVMLRSFHEAHAEILNQAFVQDLAACYSTCNLDVIINAYYEHNDTMLYNRDITDAPWAHVLCNVGVTEFLTDMVQRYGWAAPAHHWDFTTITLCSLLTSVQMSKHNWGCTKVAMLAHSVLRLFRAVQLFVSGIRAESERHQPPPHVADLTAEWRDIFAPDLYHNLFATALHLLESCPTTPVTSNRARVLDQWIATTRHLDWQLVAAPFREDQLSLKRLAGAAARVLRDPLHHAYKYFAYYFAHALAVPLALEDATKLSLWSDENQAEGEDEKTRPEFSLDYFHDAFTDLQEIVEAALSNVVVGEETCEMVPMSDSHSMALGWLLLVDLLAELSALARGDLAQHHIQTYRERQYVEPVLSTALRLLPAQVFEAAQRTTPPPPHLTRLFHQLDPLDINVACGGELGALACRAVRGAVCGAGCGGARGWAAAAPRAAARLLERLVCAHIAPQALRDQLQTLQQRAAEIENAQVRVAWSTSEVSCVYSVDERQIEVRVFLSRSYPLTAPRLDASDASGPGTNTQWLAHYLAYQNGTLLNTLKMWTKAVSAHVESTPQCYICYCRLHPSTGRLPRVPCYQCNNKFHSVCLHKWFKTSAKASCPLCRSRF